MRYDQVINFAAETPAGGIGALGLNVKSFIFQLITFLIVLWILRRYVFPKLVASLEQRRQVLEQSLIQAKQTEDALKAAHLSASELLKKAQHQADLTLAETEKKAQALLREAESKGAVQAERILAEAHKATELERLRLKRELKHELGDLVVAATEKILRQKLTSAHDKALIRQNLKEVTR